MIFRTNFSLYEAGGYAQISILYKNHLEYFDCFLHMTLPIMPLIFQKRFSELIFHYIRPEAMPEFLFHTSDFLPFFARYFANYVINFSNTIFRTNFSL